MEHNVGIRKGQIQLLKPFTLGQGLVRSRAMERRCMTGILFKSSVCEQLYVCLAVCCISSVKILIRLSALVITIQSNLYVHFLSVAFFDVVSTQPVNHELLNCHGLTPRHLNTSCHWHKYPVKYFQVLSTSLVYRKEGLQQAWHRSIGSLSCLFLMLLSAECLSICAQISTWPLIAAQCSAVFSPCGSSLAKPSV